MLCKRILVVFRGAGIESGLTAGGCGGRPSGSPPVLDCNGPRSITGSHRASPFRRVESCRTGPLCELMRATPGLHQTLRFPANPHHGGHRPFARSAKTLGFPGCEPCGEKWGVGRWATSRFDERTRCPTIPFAVQKRNPWGVVCAAHTPTGTGPGVPPPKARRFPAGLTRRSSLD